MQRRTWGAALLLALGLLLALAASRDTLASPTASVAGWGDIVQITDVPGVFWSSPRISGDGEWLAFQRSPYLYTARSDGSSSQEFASTAYWSDISADGSRVVGTSASGGELYLYTGGERQDITPCTFGSGGRKACLTPSNEAVAISGDGQWAYYISDKAWPCAYVDEDLVCFGNLDLSREVWRIALGAGNVTQVTDFDTGPGTGPWWVSSDYGGTKLALTVGAGSDVYLYSADGDGIGLQQLAETRPSAAGSHRNLAFISGDGQWIVFTGKNASGFSEATIIRSDGTERRQLLDGYGCDFMPTGAKCSISLDGSLIAVGILGNQTMLLDREGNDLGTIPGTQLDISYFGDFIAFRSTRALLGLGSETDQQVFVMSRLGAPALTLSGGQAPKALCPGEALASPVDVLTVTLAVDDVAKWQAHSIAFQGSGTGHEQNDIEAVELYLGDQLLSSGAYAADDGQITLAINRQIPAGTSLDLRLVYRFRDPGVTPWPVGTYGVETRAAWVSAEPVEPSSDTYDKGPEAPVEGGPHLIAAVQNTHTLQGFASIQGAIDAGDTQDGHTIAVCPGLYSENVHVTKALTIASTDGREVTTVRAQNTDAHVFYTTKGATTIQGFTITGASSAKGIWAEQGITVRQARVTQNAEGIYSLEGPFAAAQLQVLQNAGPGIVIASDSDVLLTDVDIRDNQGDGIGAMQGLTLGGVENAIVNNGGHGIWAGRGDVAIEAPAQIHGNGGWGIQALGGSLSVQAGAMERIHDNGGGGIMGHQGVSLPPGFVVENNGGPGIVTGANTRLEDITVRDNQGDGIGAMQGLTLGGVANAVVNNGGHGIWAGRGDVAIEAPAQIHGNGGWGIQALGGSLSVQAGAMERIHDNGGGGIMGHQGVSLPPGFVVENNGGPGILSVNRDLYLDGAKVRGNQGDGIGVVFGNLTLVGLGTEILSNAGHGVNVRSGSLRLSDADISSNAGWGIWAMGGDLMQLADVDVQQNGLGGIRADRISLQAHRLILDLNRGTGLAITGPMAALQNAWITHNSGYGILAVDTVLSLWGVLVHENALGGVMVVEGGSGSAVGAESDRINVTSDAGSGSSISGSTFMSNGADGIHFAGGPGGLVVSRSNLVGNAGYALVNADPSATVTARGNWWGQPHDPGALISGNVDYDPWSADAHELSVSSDADPVFAPRAASYSTAVHLQNWQPVTDTVRLTIEESEGWLSSSPVLDVSLEEGVGATVLLELTIPEETPLGATSRVTVSGESLIYPSATDTAVFDIIVASLADLAVTKEGRPDEPLVGAPLTYTLAITNAGPDSATGVTLTDTLSSATTFAEATPSQGVCDELGGALVCDLGDIANGGAVTVTVAVTPTIAGEISNTVRVSSPERDPVLYNNLATEHNTVSAPTAAAAVELSGPRSGPQHTFHTFVARVNPVTTTLPITYTWSVTGQWWGDQVRTTYSVSDTINLMWHTPESQTIAVTAVNAYGDIVGAMAVFNGQAPPIYLPLVLRAAR